MNRELVDVHFAFPWRRAGAFSGEADRMESRAFLERARKGQRPGGGGRYSNEHFYFTNEEIEAQKVKEDA